MTTRNRSGRTAIAAALPLLFAMPIAVYGDDGAERIKTRLIGYQEVPVVASGAAAAFRARIADDDQSFTWELSYSGTFNGAITQAHIHVGQRSVNGGISIWLCSNLNPPGSTPPGTPACPPSPATISGTATAANVVGPALQGIAPGQFAKVLDAIRSGLAYANIHSTTQGGGEIRGQLNSGDHDH